MHKYTRSAEFNPNSDYLLLYIFFDIKHKKPSANSYEKLFVLKTTLHITKGE